jgi:hypothetical protein
MEWSPSNDAFLDTDGYQRFDMDTIREVGGSEGEGLRAAWGCCSGRHTFGGALAAAPLAIPRLSWAASVRLRPAHSSPPPPAARRPPPAAQGKAACKAALQAELGLPVNPHAPLLGFIGRLDYQKGVDLICDSYDWLMSQGAQLVGGGRLAGPCPALPCPALPCPALPCPALPLSHPPAPRPTCAPAGHAGLWPRGPGEHAAGHGEPQQEPVPRLGWVLRQDGAPNHRRLRHPPHALALRALRPQPALRNGLR